VHGPVAPAGESSIIDDSQKCCCSQLDWVGYPPPPFHGRTTLAVSETAASSGPDSIEFSVGTTVSDAEKGLILRTLEHTHNNKTRAADILGISLKTLHNKLKEYGASAAVAE
jgi:DNA-binding NtrC family response regulator